MQHIERTYLYTASQVLTDSEFPFVFWCLKTWKCSWCFITHLMTDTLRRSLKLFCNCEVIKRIIFCFLCSHEHFPSISPSLCLIKSCISFFQCHFPSSIPPLSPALFTSTRVVTVCDCWNKVNEQVELREVFFGKKTLFLDVST